MWESRGGGVGGVGFGVAGLRMGCFGASCLLSLRVDFPSEGQLSRVSKAPHVKASEYQK